LLVLAVTLTAALTAVPVASATFSNTPDPTWMTNGTVYSVVRSGDTVYLGGKFSQVRACPSGQTCTGNYPVRNVAAFNANTGLPIKTFKPLVSGGDTPTVYALAVMSGKLFIGGQFTDVSGQPRLNFAAVDAVSGAVDPAVDARVGVDATGFVRTLLAGSSRLYVGGSFKSVDGVTRQRLAAFDASGNLSNTWKPRASAAVKSLVFSADGAKVFVGGSFRNAAGTSSPVQARPTVARFDAVTGALDTWSIPAGVIPNGLSAYDLAVTPLDHAPARLFVAYGGSNAIYAIDISDDDGNVVWQNKTGGNVQTVAVYRDKVLFGGHFTQVGDIFAGGNANIRRIRFAASDYDGRIDPWAPSFDGSFFGPWDILATGNQVWVGGGFTNVSGTPQTNIARFTDM
jgi:hypothetical protein